MQHCRFSEWKARRSEPDFEKNIKDLNPMYWHCLPYVYGKFIEWMRKMIECLVRTGLA
jgi:hypothetical protein